MKEMDMYKEVVIVMLDEFTCEDLIFLRQVYTMIRRHLERKDSFPYLDTLLNVILQNY